MDHVGRKEDNGVKTHRKAERGGGGGGEPSNPLYSHNSNRSSRENYEQLFHESALDTKL